MGDSPEAEVVHSLKTYLLQEGLRQGRVSDIIVDSDGAYRASRFAKALEPMASIRIDGCRPDILCSVRYSSHTLVAAFEVKAKLTDWLKGIAQARIYRSGAHNSYLALPSIKETSDSRLTRVIKDAGNAGVGLLVRGGKGWTEIVTPSNPQPLPWLLNASASALRGISAARRLQLNHPLNYLIVPFLRSQHPETPLEQLLESQWPDLQRPGTRRHAIDGAKALGLITHEGALSPDGATVADLLVSVGFNPILRPSKRARLADVAPPLAAVARSVMLRQPAIQLIIESLMVRNNHSLKVIELFREARARDEVLATALFLNNPDCSPKQSLNAADFNPSMVFKFKQVIWHAGILASKADSSAGGTAVSYRPDNDLWTLDSRLIQARIG
jgi:hypothetical protein